MDKYERERKRESEKEDGGKGGKRDVETSETGSGMSNVPEVTCTAQKGFS
jgi:hypothetical protein